MKLGTGSAYFRTAVVLWCRAVNRAAENFERVTQKLMKEFLFSAVLVCCLSAGAQIDPVNSLDATPAPEPTSWVLGLTAVALVALWRWRGDS